MDNQSEGEANGGLTHLTSRPRTPCLLLNPKVHCRPSPRLRTRSRLQRRPLLSPDLILITLPRPQRRPLPTLHLITPTSAAPAPSFAVPQLPAVPLGVAPGFPIPQTAPAHGPNVPVAIVGSDPRKDAHVLRTPGDSTPRPAGKENVAAPPGPSLRTVFRSLQDHQSPVSGSPDRQGDHENSSKQTPRATL